MYSWLCIPTISIDMLLYCVHIIQQHQKKIIGITRSSRSSRGTPGPCAAAAQRAPWTPPDFWECCWELHNSQTLIWWGLMISWWHCLWSVDQHPGFWSLQSGIGILWCVGKWFFCASGSFCHTMQTKLRPPLHGEWWAQPLRFAALVACFMGATDGLSLGTGSLDPILADATLGLFGHQEIGMNMETWWLTTRFWVFLGYP